MHQATADTRALSIPRCGLLTFAEHFRIGCSITGLELNLDGCLKSWMRTLDAQPTFRRAWIAKGFGVVERAVIRLARTNDEIKEVGHACLRGQLR